jgi:circadian clock protein KaiB
MGKLSLTLFVTGRTVRSRAAVQHLRSISQGLGEGQYELRIVDVLEQPHLAEESKILATPTLVKNSPPPVRRIVGDLGDRERVMKWLDLEGNV